MIEEIFEELINEASNSKVIIDNEEWPIGFNTLIIDQNGKEIFYGNDKNLSQLVIKDKNTFINMLKEYVTIEKNMNRKIPNFLDNSDKNKLKWIIAYLFVNATTEDFLEPINYIKRRIAFLKDNTFSYLNDGIYLNIGNHFLDSSIKITNKPHSIAMETPYKIDISLVNYFDDKELHYHLATISYGIETIKDEKVCYIYSIMKPKSKNNEFPENTLYEKKMSRMLYKLNNGISNYEMPEYFEYNEEDIKDYPEGNITDVSPSSILSLNIFISLLQREGIHKVRAVPYLPLRYLSRDLSASSIVDEDKKYQLRLRNDKIQENITNKFIRAFRRLAFHNPDIAIKGIPYELSEYLEVDISNKEHMLNNPILEDISMSVYKMEENINKEIHR